jgi:hypothetical protein
MILVKVTGNRQGVSSFLPSVDSPAPDLGGFLLDLWHKTMYQHNMIST